jgi:hypothetical protein
LNTTVLNHRNSHPCDREYLSIENIPSHRMVKKGTSIKLINLTGKKRRLFKCRISDMETVDFELFQIPST